jgi:hypothetical protein
MINEEVSMGNRGPYPRSENFDRLIIELRDMQDREGQARIREAADFIDDALHDMQRDEKAGVLRLLRTYWRVP